MIPEKPIAEWQQIFLDTSFIIDYLSDANRITKNPEYKERIEITQKVMKILNAKDNSANIKRRTYYVSAITISELRRLEHDNSISKQIVLIFEAADVTFVDYTKDIANLTIRMLDESLPKGQKHQFIAYLQKELIAKNFANARQWVSDDLKIIASAKSVKNLDVVLTSDKNTFQLIANQLEIPCIAMFRDQFQFDLFGEISVLKNK